MDSKPAPDDLPPSDLKTTVNAVAVKLPEFYPGDTASWFLLGGGKIWYLLHYAG